MCWSIGKIWQQHPGQWYHLWPDVPLQQQGRHPTYRIQLHEEVVA